MSWIEQLESVFHNTPVRVNVDLYDKSGCILNFESLPNESVVIDVDLLAENDAQVRTVFGGDARCDVAVFNFHEGIASVVLIEATTAGTKVSRKMREAIDQIAKSFNHLEQIMRNCNIVVPDLDRYAVVASKRISPNLINNATARQEREEFEKTFGTEVRYVRCGRDIWQAIQGDQSPIS